jgi:tRNA pseudouridine55 synthase
MDLLPPEHGFLVVDKPAGVTSHDVVQSIRRILKVRKVGHLGTLDPMATGVLPIAAGKATRLIEFLKSNPKIYQGVIQLGFSTNTYDKEGQPSSKPVPPNVSQKQLDQIAIEMSGEQWQVPPPYSAKKVAGQRAYRLARSGSQVPIAPQRIDIEHLTLLLRGSGEVHFTIRCTAGTYVRSVAHDLGDRVGCGGHLSQLRRLASGEFSEDQAVTLAECNELSKPELAARMIPLAGVMNDCPKLIAGPEAEQALSVGRNFRLSPPGEVKARPLYRVFSARGELLGVAEPLAHETLEGGSRDAESWFHPVLVFFPRG